MRRQAVSYDELPQAPADDADSEKPDLYAIRNAAGDAIHAALQQLREDYRRAFVLRHVQDLSVQQVAEILGIPENTVKTHVRRARSELREILRQWGWG